MTWPAIVFWLLIVIGVFTRGPLLLYLFFAAGSFGSLQMVPGEGVGGANLLPQSVIAAFLILKIVLKNGQIARAIEAALDPGRLALLFLFLAYGFLSAYTMPRLFMHSVEVIPISVQLPWAVLLEPSAANITQPAYMALSIGMALAFTLEAERSEFRWHYLVGSLIGGVVAIGTGFGDMVLSSVGLADLLEPFRNATYGLMLDIEIVGGRRRVVGLMPEASAYGALCIGAAANIAFLRPCYSDRLRRLVAPAVILGLVVFGLLSTSSTAYVGIAFFGLILGANWLRRSLDRQALARDELKWELYAALAAAFLLIIVVTLFPTLLDPVYELLDSIIFKKAESDSYIERSMWTRVGMEAFFATHGLGVGLGSDRTSNWFVAILSNTGVIGAGLLGAFIVRLYLLRSPKDPYSAEYLAGLRFSLLPGFVMSALAGTTPDIGVGVGATFGMIVGLATAKREPTLVRNAQPGRQKNAATADRPARTSIRRNGP